MEAVLASCNAVIRNIFESIYLGIYSLYQKMAMEIEQSIIMFQESIVNQTNFNILDHD
jgi:hypothetical protein